MGWGGVLRRLLGERLARLARRVPIGRRRQLPRREFSPEDLEDAGLNTGVPRPSEWTPDPHMDPYRRKGRPPPPEGPELQQERLRFGILQTGSARVIHGLPMFARTKTDYGGRLGVMTTVIL